MALRARIVDAAEKSFSMFGYKGTTMEQVARIANVGKGTIYTFFDSKEALFTSILNSMIEDLRQTAVAAIKPGRPFLRTWKRRCKGSLGIANSTSCL